VKRGQIDNLLVGTSGIVTFVDRSGGRPVGEKIARTSLPPQRGRPGRATHPHQYGTLAGECRTRRTRINASGLAKRFIHGGAPTVWRSSDESPGERNDESNGGGSTVQAMQRSDLHARDLPG
jgi:hypothetical protein